MKKKKEKSTQDKNASDGFWLGVMLTAFIAGAIVLIATKESNFYAGECYIIRGKPQMIVNAYNSINDYTTADSDGVKDHLVTLGMLTDATEDKGCNLFHIESIRSRISRLERSLYLIDDKLDGIKKK